MDKDRCFVTSAKYGIIFFVDDQAIEAARADIEATSDLLERAAFDGERVPKLK